MDFCDKCGEEIDTLEPCLRISHGFLNTDKSFSKMVSVHIHIDCCSDTHLLSEILSKFDKN
tara:strand:- start:4521 stop:4703 length:183 start_codon:yes stop_codon:yes gene_type:complete